MDESSISIKGFTKNSARMSSLKFERDLIARDAILVGPEGGFSSKERDSLVKYSFTRSINLGTQLLRSETAAIVALALWNELFNIKQ